MAWYFWFERRYLYDYAKSMRFVPSARPTTIDEANPGLCAGVFLMVPPAGVEPAREFPPEGF